MAVLSDTLQQARSDPSGWLARADAEGTAQVEALLASLPEDVRDAALSALLDPVRHTWAFAALVGLRRATRAGAVVMGMAHEDLVELADARGHRFVLAPVACEPEPAPLGQPDDVDHLLTVLDGILGHLPYHLHISRRLPESPDVQSVARAVRLWVSELGRKKPKVSRSARYEDGGVCIDIALGSDKLGKGRILTIGPTDALERLHRLERQLIDAVARHEQSVGEVPLVLALGAAKPWRLPRGYVQLQLYGTPGRVNAVRAEGRRTYEAWFAGDQSALLNDPMFRFVTALWWTHTADAPPDDPLNGSFVGHENPWASVLLELAVQGQCFRCIDLAADRTAFMRWEA